MRLIQLCHFGILNLEILFIAFCYSLYLLPRDPHPIPRPLEIIILYIFNIQAIQIILGTFHLYRPEYIIFATHLYFLAVLLLSRGYLAGIWQYLYQSVQKRYIALSFPAFTLLNYALVMIILGQAIEATLYSPWPTGLDVDTYHYPCLLNHKNFQSLLLPYETSYYCYPGATELLAFWFILPFDWPYFYNLQNLPFFILIWFGLRALFSRRHEFMAHGLFFVFLNLRPIRHELVGSNDTSLVAGLFATIYFLLVFACQKNKRSLIFLYLSLSILLGAKVLAPLYLLLALIFLAVFKGRTSFGRMLQALWQYRVYSFLLLFGLFWWLRIIFTRGNFMKNFWWLLPLFDKAAAKARGATHLNYISQYLKSKETALELFRAAFFDSFQIILWSALILVIPAILSFRQFKNHPARSYLLLGLKAILLGLVLFIVNIVIPHNCHPFDARFALSTFLAILIGAGFIFAGTIPFTQPMLIYICLLAGLGFIWQKGFAIPDITGQASLLVVPFILLKIRKHWTNPRLNIALPVFLIGLSLGLLFYTGYQQALQADKKPMVEKILPWQPIYHPDFRKIHPFIKETRNRVIGVQAVWFFPLIFQGDHFSNRIVWIQCDSASLIEHLEAFDFLLTEESCLQKYPVLHTHFETKAYLHEQKRFMLKRPRKPQGPLINRGV